MFSKSTCSGVSEISNLCLVHKLLGSQVPQHDVASKRDIKQIRPFAQSAHATICDAITQPLAMFNKGSLFYSHCDKGVAQVAEQKKMWVAPDFLAART
jgi:hypothetical protein